MRVKILVVLSVIMALITAYSVFNYLESVKQQALSEEDYNTVYVASEYIPQGKRITADMVSRQQVPRTYIHEGAAIKKEEVIGKIATGGIYSGEQIISPKLASAGESEQGLVYAIDPGKRAITLGINPVSGVAGFLNPGDRVDAVATIKVPYGGRNTSVTKTIVQNVEVLAAGENWTDGKNREPDIEMETVTLEVSPREAQLLSLAMEEGSINLILRSPADKGKTELPVSLPGSWIQGS